MPDIVTYQVGFLEFELDLSKRSGRVALRLLRWIGGPR